MRPIINSALSITVLILAVLCSPTVLANVSTADNPDPTLRKLLTEAIESADSFENRFDAEVWLVDMSSRMKKFVADEQHRLTLLRGIHREASRANLVPELVLAVIEIESRFDHFAISTAGAQGLMQVMPFWLKEIGHPDDNLVNINTNLRMGCTILRYYMDMEKNDLHKALARYNGSTGSRKYSNKVLEALRVNWHKR
ncbi:MAG: lytic transglycosylase domain-containing protein [Gammaproteobacteria bacterium]|nr:lytic transglycosylase domain-containing protein [Gammaproteobacteria bacterium]